MAQWLEHWIFNREDRVRFPGKTEYFFSYASFLCYGFHVVRNSRNYSYQCGELTVLQNQSIISLIPKSAKDITILENWRPISLLNVDYKIATKAIANRLKHVLPNIINNSQTGFLKGRYIGENIRILFELLDYVEENEIPGMVFFSDFEKALDSIDHEFLMKCLKHFNLVKII